MYIPQGLRATCLGPLPWRATLPPAGAILPHTCKCLQGPWLSARPHAILGPEDRLVPHITTTADTHTGQLEAWGLVHPACHCWHPHAPLDKARAALPTTDAATLHVLWILRIDVSCLTPLVLAHTTQRPKDRPIPAP